MFENITILHIQPGMQDDCLLLLRAHIIPILHRQSGLLSLAVVPLPEQNLISILSIWVSASCARAVESNPFYRREIQRIDLLIQDANQFTRKTHSTRPSKQDQLALSYN